MAKTDRQKFNALIKRHDAIVRETGERFYALGVEAPRGHIWSGSQLHELIAEQAHGEPRSKIYEDFVERMASGIEICATEDCEWCER